LHGCGRGAKADTCGRSFAVLSTHISAAGLRLRPNRQQADVVPKPIPAAPRRYLIVMYRQLLAAPLVVCCVYMAVVPRAMPAAVASRYCRRRLKQLACACDTAGWRVVSCLN
jgi:hypothetical protein